MKYNTATQTLACEGDWTLPQAESLKEELKTIPWPTSGQVTFDFKDISKMDSAGAVILSQTIYQLEEQSVKVSLTNLPENYKNLLTIVKKQNLEKIPIPTPKKLNWFAKLGKSSVALLDEFIDFLAFIGKLTYELLRVLRKPILIRWSELTSIVDKTGIRAMPIIALLSFMIGIVIAYQMGIQLRNYGANIFIVNLLGLSVLREFGPLITAIMVAGRTGSSFTAQLGIMKINQEIDALDTMSVTPGELLLIPRIIGLLIVLPLLTMWANVFGIIGGMIMANNMLNIGWHDFLIRFQHEIPLRALIIGLGKAPFFALLIASIGCFQGMRVESTADSLGSNTTRSVVLSIFFIIVVDAIFSVILSKLQL